MSESTVTVYTADHGAVTMPEPSWCLGPHRFEAYREDIVHEGDQSLALIPTLCHGEAPTLTVSLIQRPFSPSRSEVVASLFIDGDWHELDADMLEAAAVEIVEHADRLREFARKLREVSR